MTRDAEKRQIAEAAAQFPAEFGLAGFPGEVFRIEKSACFISEGRLYLYTSIKRNGHWQTFAKGTVGQLRNEMVAL